MSIQQMLNKTAQASTLCDACDFAPCQCSAKVCGLAFSQAFVEDDE